MKEGIHPDYHPVVFHDVGSGIKFLTRSTMSSKDKVPTATTSWATT